MFSVNYSANFSVNNSFCSFPQLSANSSVQDSTNIMVAFYTGGQVVVVRMIAVYTHRLHVM